jgi:hypothetical protein
MGRIIEKAAQRIFDDLSRRPRQEQAYVLGRIAERLITVTYNTAKDKKEQAYMLGQIAERLIVMMYDIVRDKNINIKK